MKLYSYYRSSTSYRVRIALNLKGISYKTIPVDVTGGEHKGECFREKNPQGLVPTIDDEGFILSQSLAIIDYLNRKVITPSLYPEKIEDRVVVESMAMIVACEIHPINNPRVLNYVKEHFCASDQDMNVWYGHWIKDSFKALEKLTRQYGSDKFCFGNTISTADICLVPQMYNARRFNVDVSEFPRLVAIDKFLMQKKSFIDALPENQPDST